jgi:hypothetical protein
VVNPRDCEDSPPPVAVVVYKEQVQGDPDSLLPWAVPVVTEDLVPVSELQQAHERVRELERQLDVLQRRPPSTGSRYYGGRRPRRGDHYSSADDDGRSDLEVNSGGIVVDRTTPPPASELTTTQEASSRSSFLPTNPTAAQLYAVVILCVVGLGAAVGVCQPSAGRCSSSASGIVAGVPSPPAATTTTELSPRARSILDFINAVTLTGRILSYPDDTTAEGRAIQWLIDEDTATAVTNELTLRQRYGLATLYFQNASTAATSLTNWTNTTLSECEWQGVQCDGPMGPEVDESSAAAAAVVTRLGLTLANVGGRLSTDVGLLTALTELSLFASRVTGTIPSSLERLTALTKLDLSGNLLTGTLPATMLRATHWPALLALSLGGNQLTGTIPATMGTLKTLTSLVLALNQFTGTIPSSLGDLTALNTWLMDDNQLRGTIPASLGSLTALMFMTFAGNGLTGTIPSSLEALTDLAVLALHTNELDGTMPFCQMNNRNNFTFLIADCGKVSCPCCTACCPIGQGAIPAYNLC